LSKGYQAATEKSTAVRAAEAAGGRGPSGAYLREDLGGIGADQLRAGDPKSGPGKWLQWDPENYSYRLSAEARAELQPVFDNWGYDTSKARGSFGSRTSTNGNAAFTLGDDIIINRDSWFRRAQDPQAQLRLLAHEVTHCVQYRDLGRVAFLARYATEYPRGDNYIPPAKLINTRIEIVDHIDERYTLDQIAKRVEMEF
jgi:hypothetical protein